MDVALLLLLPLVGGYYLANSSYAFRYRSAREDGHRLYFKSAFLGVILFCAALIVRSQFLNIFEWYRSFEVFLSQLILPLVKEPEKGYQFPLAVISLYSMILGPLLGYGGNFFLNRDTWLSRALKYSDLERLLNTAAHRKTPVCLTMANNKVYVGFIVASVDPTRDLKSLGILPVISGYRDGDTGKITFTTDYRPIYKLQEKGTHDAQLPLQHLRAADFEIILPTDKIHSCNMFDFTAYNQFNKKVDDDTG